jgi:16S rRNA (guanine966-N2)-methyltransferase
MRVIAGLYKGRNLRSPPSLEVRPTSDRLRETLFNVIASVVAGKRFLDLCAGSGAVGIEALSRGAVHATFVDRSRKMCQLIESNLALCRIEESQNEIYSNDVNDFLKQALSWKMAPWSIIFFDPPYKDDYIQTLQFLGHNWPKLATEDGLLIVEHHHKNLLPDEIGNIERVRLLKQGDSSLSFYR